MTEHVDSWDTNRCGLPARLAWNASRAAWSLAETSKDLREDAGKLLGKVKGDDSGGRQVETPHGPWLCRLYMPASVTSNAGSGRGLHQVMPQMLWQIKWLQQRIHFSVLYMTGGQAQSCAGEHIRRPLRSHQIFPAGGQHTEGRTGITERILMSLHVTKVNRKVCLIQLWTWADCGDFYT